jgi:hypothetical protein
MHHIKFSTIFLIALLVLSTEVVAQKIYKCGTTYSQQACPDGVIVPAAPTPDTAKTTAADQATRRDALTADRMEKSRLQQEKKDLAANTPDFKRKARATSTQAEVKPLVKKRTTMGKDEEFRAVVPGTVTPKNHSKK